jgi:hypothetical protein
MLSATGFFLQGQEYFYQRLASQRAYVSQFREYMKLHTSARERSGFGEVGEGRLRESWPQW